MKLHKPIGMFLSFVVTLSLFGCGGSTQTQQEVAVPNDYKGLMKYFEQTSTSDTVDCWYTDVDDKSWLENASVDFEKKYGKKVNLVYYDGVRLFDDMNQNNQKGKGPDVYIAGNDQLELAVTTAMAQENTWLDDTLWSEQYPEVAKNAATYKEKQYGYPLYFDTYCLVYDANLLETAPASIDDILDFADAYEDTGATKAIFRWDVADPYINSMFVASYADIFGKQGDDVQAFEINNEASVEAMQYFQSLSQYLWMNKNNISHDTVKNRIQEGSLVLGLCKTDILPVLESMKENENTNTKETEESEETEENEEKEDTNYKVSYVPSLTKEKSSLTYSTTYSAFVNPYAKDESAGNMFALYLSVVQSETQYEKSGKLPVVNQKDSFGENEAIIYAQYLNSTPVPKVIALGDYLSQSAIAYDAIWDGKDVKEQLDWLQDIMKKKTSE